jgi:hypothetical protein
MNPNAPVRRIANGRVHMKQHLYIIHATDIQNKYRSQIHDHTISLRFLGIILRVLRREVSVWISLNHREEGMVFYQVFLLSTLQKL